MKLTYLNQDIVENSQTELPLITQNNPYCLETHLACQKTMSYPVDIPA